VNFLAHLLLSGDEPDWIVGGLLGDFVKGPLKGPLKGQYSSGIEAGIRLHRQIDLFTDQHPHIKHCQTFFGPELRRFSGIIVDIGFDHFLAKHWHRFDDRELTEFNSEVLTILNQYRSRVPDNASLFIERMTSHEILLRYRDAEAIPQILKRTGQRLSRPTPLIESGEQFLQQYSRLETVFFEFFPELVAFALKQRGVLMGDQCED